MKERIVQALINKGVVRALQFYWRRSRGLTMGAQGLVIDEQGRVLLVRHAYYRRGWHFPGGGVEKGETLVQALARELSEEAGVEPTGPPQLFGVYANFRAFPSDHVALFIVQNWRQPSIPRPNKEIAEQRFVSADDLPEGTAPGVRRRLGEVFGGAERGEFW